MSLKLHLLSGGRLSINKEVFTPGRDGGKRIVTPVWCILIRHPQGLVLFDTGCHPSVATDAAGRWGGLARAFVPVSPPGEDVVTALHQVGVEPADVDLVVNSHLHMDHCGANEFFPHATWLVHARELETARDPEVEGKGYFKADWDHPLRLETVNGERDLFGDGRVVLFPTPGHTPGSMAAAVRLTLDGLLLLASDAAVMRENLEEEIIPRNTWEPSAYADSLGVLRRWRERGALVVFGHDPEQAVTLKTGAAHYE